MSSGPTSTTVPEFAQSWDIGLKSLSKGTGELSDVISVAQAWQIACKHLYPRDINVPRDRPEQAVLIDAYAKLRDVNLINPLLDWFIGKQAVRQQGNLLARDIKVFMDRWEVIHDPEIIIQLIVRLGVWSGEWRCETTAFNYHGVDGHFPFRRAFRILLLASLPSTFPQAFKETVIHILPKSADFVGHFFGMLDGLAILDDFETVIAGVLKDEIEAKVMEVCPMQWTEPQLPGLRRWFQETVVPWLSAVYARASGQVSAEQVRADFQPVCMKFDYHMCKILCNLRISECFDIIIDYDNSAPALYDLKECLSRTSQRTELIRTLRKVNNKRLLHPGADTKDILLYYTSTIKCLRLIDGSGSLLYSVADPIRRYLRDRPDTIRSIVSNLVGDKNDLVDSNEPVGPIQDLQDQAEDYSDYANWNPEPIDAEPGFRAGKASDIISTLVSIYSSKDLFVKELQILLAQRLVAITNTNYDDEIRNVEILKIRFGEAALHVCDVMMKDMADSKRVDQHVQSQNTSELHPLIISRLFWPNLGRSSLQMPGRLKELQQQYEKEFHVFKPDKKLHWLSHLGTVTLELEMNDGRTMEVHATPLQAGILELFSEQDVWEAAELAEKLGKIDRPTVDKALLFWLDRGILKDLGGGNYKLLEDAEQLKAKNPRRGQLVTMMEENLETESAAKEQLEKMKVFWQYIRGMLINLGPRSVDQIHGSLKFAPHYDRTVEQLQAFLEDAKKEQLVEFKDGLWQLKRKG